MLSTNLLKTLLVIFVIFAIGEMLFTLQRYGFPKLDLFKTKPGSCKILEEKFCSPERIILDVNRVKVNYYLAFNLPNGTPIFAPIDGLLVKAQESGNLSGFLGQIRTPSGVAIFRGDIKFDDMLQKDVKKGDIIGHIGNTGVKIGNSAFNTAFTLTKISSSGPVIDEANLKGFFPKASTKFKE